MAPISAEPTPPIPSPGDLIAFQVPKPQTTNSGNPSLESSINSIEILTSPSTALDACGDAMRWRKPGTAIPRMTMLKARHALLRAIRRWFDSGEFTEVQTPLMVPAPSPEPQFRPVQAGDQFLITSPEFQMKRLLVGGFERIYQIGPCFRGMEVGSRHNPEFFLLEWYRAYDRLDAMAADLEGLICSAVKAVAALHPAFLEAHSRTDFTTPWPRTTVQSVMIERLGIDPLATESGVVLRRLAMESVTRSTSGRSTNPTIAQATTIEEMGIALQGADTYEEVFFRLWDCIESDLGVARPLFVHDWPLPLASLAQKRTDRPGVAERMELYINGVELANGFGELTDAAEQRRRFELDLAARQTDGLRNVPLDEAFLESLGQGMPPSSGMAMGIERLLMLLTGAQEIREVMAFAWDER